MEWFPGYVIKWKKHSAIEYCCVRKKGKEENIQLSVYFVNTHTNMDTSTIKINQKTMKLATCKGRRKSRRERRSPPSLRIPFSQVWLLETCWCSTYSKSKIKSTEMVRGVGNKNETWAEMNLTILQMNDITTLEGGKEWSHNLNKVLDFIPSASRIKGAAHYV